MASKKRVSLYSEKTLSFNEQNGDLEAEEKPPASAEAYGDNLLHDPDDVRRSVGAVQETFDIPTSNWDWE